MLLTSSQVSLAISSGVIAAFTLALFLAGYVLQQQTVHELRAVITPRFESLKATPKPTPGVVAGAVGQNGQPVVIGSNMNGEAVVVKMQGDRTQTNTNAQRIPQAVFESQQEAGGGQPQQAKVEPVAVEAEKVDVVPDPGESRTEEIIKDQL